MACVERRSLLSVPAAVSPPAAGGPAADSRPAVPPDAVHIDCSLLSVRRVSASVAPNARVRRSSSSGSGARKRAEKQRRSIGRFIHSLISRVYFDRKARSKDCVSFV